MSAPISLRALNRAYLARQLLLERSEMSPLEALEHLIGVQGQAPWPPYYALACRLASFDPHELGRLILDRQAARIVVMRGTIHLLTARDALPIRALTQPVIERNLYATAPHRTSLKGLDLAPILDAARDILESEPLVQRQLGERLAERFPHLQPAAMAYAVRAMLPLVQVPPRGVWGRTGQPVLAPADTYLAGARPQDVTLEDLIRRYLAAYGPASIADIQAWSGLTRLRDVVEDMRPGLLTYQAESGPELFDIPGAPHPDPDTPAPVRFLAEFDNATLSHAERTRVIRDDLRRRIATRNGMVPGMVLVDGWMAATYNIARKKDAATVRIIEYRRLSHPERQAIEAEAQTTARMGHSNTTVTLDFLPAG